MRGASDLKRGSQDTGRSEGGCPVPAGVVQKGDEETARQVREDSGWERRSETQWPVGQDGGALVPAHPWQLGGVLVENTVKVRVGLMVDWH